MPGQLAQEHRHAAEHHRTDQHARDEGSHLDAVADRPTRRRGWPHRWTQCHRWSEHNVELVDVAQRDNTPSISVWTSALPNPAGHPDVPPAR